MNEKTSKNPVLVVATIIFLALFIVLPPVFRKYIPKEEGFVEEVVVKHTLYCERTSISENKKITSEILYENDVAVKNVMTFMDYTPTAEDKGNDSGNVPVQTVEQEVNYLKSLVNIEVQENASQTVIEITQRTALDNPMDANLLNYVGDTDSAITYFESLGFVCSKIED